MTASLFPPGSPRRPSLKDEHRAAVRELHMRQSAYPKWVAAGRMKQETAEWEIACMAAIVERLEAELAKLR